jgi:hypothetical protein
MDFITGFPETKHKHDALFVVMDKFSKFATHIPCTKAIQQNKQGLIFFQCAGPQFGLPTSIIVDRDSRFVNTIWKTLWMILDTKLKMSAAFHP